METLWSLGINYRYVGSIPAGKGAEKAEAALKKLGAVEPMDPGYKGSWAFAGFKGAHHTKNWVTQVSRPRYHGPAMVADMINTPAADQGIVFFEAVSFQKCAYL